ncbi:MAG: PIN domain-containing protein [Anaerolineales bacterium]|nr:PIN domain-containing protein [Anaerolineales bacterium]
MRVLLDTNIILDVLLRREPWRAEADALWQANDIGRLTAYLTATTLTDIYYVARKATDVSRARQALQLCLDVFEIAPVHRITLERAQQMPGADFEDNVQIACAEAGALDALVTRDKASFSAASLPVLTPAECLRQLGAAE